MVRVTTVSPLPILNDKPNGSNFSRVGVPARCIIVSLVLSRD